MVTRARSAGSNGTTCSSAYRGGDKLYIPTDQIDSIVRQYAGGEAAQRCHKLGGSDFASKAKSRGPAPRFSESRARTRVCSTNKRVTAEGSAVRTGHARGRRELEDTFPFEETPDQHAAILEDVKGDMERAKFPMDRLVVAATWASARPRSRCAQRSRRVQDGKQVAVPVHDPRHCWPTQHRTNTFADRFAGYPVRVEVLSRGS